MIMFRNKNLHIPPIASAGLMMSFHCSNECKHCVYRCSPKMPDEWITRETAARIFDALAEERRFCSLHFAGGEATMQMDLLVDLIAMASRKRIPLEYLETNAYWCDDLDDTRRQFERMRAAGLPCVMVSASMYHNEFVPFRNTQTAVRAAEDVFGPSGYFVYPGHLYRLLAQLPGDGRRRLDAFCEQLGIAPKSAELHRLFPLIPAGRPLQALPEFYDEQPACEFEGDACVSRLQSPHHAHIDLYGNLFTGSCCGISPGTVEDFHPTITPEQHPIFTTLCTEGPCGLIPLAEERGCELKSGYLGKCDLCFQLRKHLHAGGDFPELRPACFYECP